MGPGWCDAADASLAERIAGDRSAGGGGQRVARAGRAARSGARPVGAVSALAVVPVAIVWGVRQAIAASLLSAAAIAYLFLPPRSSLQVDDSRSALVLVALLLTSVVVSDLAARLRRRARESARLAEEQAALRRVATLVAQSTAPAEVFEAVTREVGLRSGADLARMERYEADGTVTGVARWSREDDRLAVGTRIPLEGVSIAALVGQTSRPVRVDSFSQASGPIAEEARALGIRSSVGCPIVVRGRLWGVIAASSKRESPFPLDTESQMADFTELVATAIANAESRSALAASRARVVAAADETRRRIERDLHDGIQQRLVSLGLELRMAQSEVAAVAPTLGQKLNRVLEELKGAIDDLREVSRGIHPAALSEGGLGPALRTLARRSAVPVELELGAEERLPELVEVAAYYVISEALTNTAKHARLVRAGGGPTARQRPVAVGRRRRRRGRRACSRVRADRLARPGGGPGRVDPDHQPCGGGDHDRRRAAAAASLTRPRPRTPASRTVVVACMVEVEKIIFAALRSMAAAIIMFPVGIGLFLRRAID
jgi:signal transduction histidine kinase